MRLTGRRFSLLLLLLAVGSAAAQSKDDEESVDAGHHNGVEGSGNAPSDDEDTVEGSALPPSQGYSKLTTIHHARPAVPVKPVTAAPEIRPPPKKDPLPPIINMDLMEKEQREKEKEQSSVSIAPAIPRITTNRPENAPLVSNGFLIGILVAIGLLIIVVVVIIVVCRKKHKYTPGRQE